MLLINGEEGEKYTFRLYDHRNNVEVEATVVPEAVEFENDASYGSLNGELYELAFASSTTHRGALQLNDNADLPYSGTQYSITADGIDCSYVRNAYQDGGYESIVLPFDADITTIKEAGFVFEKLDTITDTSIRFVDLAEDEHLKAGVAYIFRYSGTPSDERQEVTFVERQTQLTDTIANNNGWTGTFNAMDGTQIAGKYILNVKGDMMQKAGDGASLSPYHAYLEVSQGMDMSRMVVMHNGQATGINSSMDSGRENVPVFDISGRIVKDKSYRGLVVCNKKVLFK